MRWSWRLFRREWRQQALVLALLTVAVGIAVLGATAAYNITPSRDAEFGAAERRVTLGASDPDALAADEAVVARWFPGGEVIGTSGVVVPGSVEALELRSQDPRLPLGRPMLALRSGRFPSSRNEIALTDDVAARLRLSIGDAFGLARLDATVVGIVENPGDLDDEFALLAPGHPAAHSRLTFLVDGEARTTSSPRDALQGGFESVRRGDTEKGTAAVLSLALATVVLLLICLVAAAGFAVIAQRRLRQLGLLAAIGATPRQLRLVVLADGVLVGVAAAVVGTSMALAAWAASAPRLEMAAGHRIPAFDVPWWLVVGGMALSLCTATTAAWWPARTVARVPITLALAERPGPPKPTRRSVSVAGALAVAGCASLAFGVDNTKEEAVAGLVIGGLVALAGAVIVASPIAVRALGRVAKRLPVAVRLALRDLGRYQARSGAALAAISLGLAIAVATIVLASAAQDGAGTGNLSDRQLLFRIGTAEPMIPERTPTDLARMSSDITALAGTLDADVIPLHAAVRLDDREGRDGVVLRPAVVIGRPIGQTTRDLGVLYVATPELVHYLGLESEVANAEVANAEVLTVHTGTLAFANTLVPELRSARVTDVERIDVAAYRSTPRSLATSAFVEEHGLTAVPAGWLVQSRRPLASGVAASARELAVANGITVESRDAQAGLAALRSIATTAGAVLALSVLAMTVGLIRSESGRDLVTLAAAGAGRRTRRVITAATAGGLALLGVLIGLAVAYGAIVAAFLDDLAPLAPVPVGHLAALALGTPLAAFLAGWTFAGRDPVGLARPPT